MIVVVIGTRPEIVKIAPMIRQLKSKSTPFTLVRSGQHYDCELSKVFFKELGLPDPSVYLENKKDFQNTATKLDTYIEKISSNICDLAESLKKCIEVDWKFIYNMFKECYGVI